MAQRGRWRRIVLALALVWLGAIMFGRIGDRLILWPTTRPIDPGRAVRRTIETPRGVVEAWVMPARSGVAQRYLLRFFGNADRAENWADAESRQWPDDVESWAVNYPGYGGSAGPSSLQAVADAALAAYDALAKIAPGKRVYVVGTSLGTTAALRLAAARPVAGVVLHNPPALRELVLGDHGWWNLWLLAYPVALQLPRDLDSVGNARRSRAPAIFVLSQADEIVRHRYHLLVADAYGGDKEIILRPGAGHNDALDGPSQARYAAALARLFAR